MAAQRKHNTARKLMIATVAVAVAIAGCSDSDETGQGDGTVVTAAPADETGEQTDPTDDSGGSGDDQDSEQDTDETRTSVGSLADSTNGSGTDGDETDDGSDETVPPPESLVPIEFCEPTRVMGQAIRFQPGAEQALIRSPAQPGQSDLYSLEVTEGQIVTVSLSSDNGDVVGILLPPSGIFVPGVFTETTVTDSEAGNYWVCVVSGDTSDRYELSVSVIDDNTPTKIAADWCGTSVNDRGEIRFAAGASSGQADNAVIRGERDLYSLEAGQGQTFRGELSALEDNAALQLRSPSGDIILNTEAEFTIELPEAGVYQLCVGGTRGNASYTIDLTIE